MIHWGRILLLPGKHLPGTRLLLLKRGYNRQGKRLLPVMGLLVMLEKIYRVKELELPLEMPAPGVEVCGLCN